MLKGRRRSTSRRGSTGLPKTYKLEKMLMAPNHILLNTIMDLNPDDLADDLVHIFEANGRGLALLKHLVDRHAQSVTNPNGLLRINDITTKVVGSLSALFGIEYLRSALGPLVREVLADPSPYVIDQDAGDKDKLNANARALVLLCQRFFDTIVATRLDLPRLNCEICVFLHDSARRRFPDLIDEHNYQVVGGFLFLRWICPAIVAPEIAGIVTEKDVGSPAAKPVLINVAKALMNLANGTHNKRLMDTMPHLGLINQFVDDNAAPLRTYFAAVLANVDAHKDPTHEVSKEEKKQSLAHIHHFIYHNMAEVERVMNSYFADQEKESRASRLMNPINTLKQIVDELGKPDEPKKQRFGRSGLVSWLTAHAPAHH